MEDLLQYCRRLRANVDAEIRSYLEEYGSAWPMRLTEAIRYCLLAPGKRLRPILVYLAAEAAGGDERPALPAACAVEMIHTYSLVHDDLPAMDDDELRRGQKTCHKQFDEATAILVGDALQALAFQVLAEKYPPRTAAACCRELARAIGAAGMVGGQMEDLAWEKGGGELEDLTLLHGKKTGALFRACLHLGVLAAQGENERGPDRKLLYALEEYGRCFGLAFQITDDLIDVEGKTEHAGKRVQKDAPRGKLTYPGILGIAESRRRAEALFAEAKEHLQNLGAGGKRLETLFQFVLARDR